MTAEFCDASEDAVVAEPSAPSAQPRQLRQTVGQATRRQPTIIAEEAPQLPQLPFLAQPEPAWFRSSADEVRSLLHSHDGWLNGGR